MFKFIKDLFSADNDYVEVPASLDVTFYNIQDTKVKSKESKVIDFDKMSVQQLLEEMKQAYGIQ